METRRLAPGRGYGHIAFAANYCESLGDDDTVAYSNSCYGVIVGDVQLAEITRVLVLTKRILPGVPQDGLETIVR